MGKGAALSGTGLVRNFTARQEPGFSTIHAHLESGLAHGYTYVAQGNFQRLMGHQRIHQALGYMATNRYSALISAGGTISIKS